jgi:hypothetical protein
MVRIEERDPNAIGGQGRTAVMERQHCSKGKGKVLGDDGGSYSGGATDVMRSKTGELAYDFAVVAHCNGFARHLAIFQWFYFYPAHIYIVV